MAITIEEYRAWLDANNQHVNIGSDHSHIDRSIMSNDAEITIPARTVIVPQVDMVMGDENQIIFECTDGMVVIFNKKDLNGVFPVVDPSKSEMVRSGLIPSGE